MENITHSLMGATLAEVVLPASASPSQRRLFFAAGIIAANLPDADLVYTRITPPPLGYLLHHRGHTHTVAGLVAQAALIGLVCLLPAIRDRIGDLRRQLALLVGVALASHLLLDSWNSYGVHPFWPLDNRWFYGDAVFIVEPWLWMLLGVPIVVSARHTRTRVAVGALLILLALLLVRIGMIGAPVLGWLGAGALAASAAMMRLAPRTRSAAALAATAVFVTGMFITSAAAKERAIRALADGPTGQLVDVVMNPNAANPLCWTALAIVKHEVPGDITMTRGDVPMTTRFACGEATGGRVRWGSATHQSLAGLRALVQRDCWARAWMQFGRAPVADAGVIADLRYGNSVRGNFSTMPLGAPGCPARITSWSLPRADLL